MDKLQLFNYWYYLAFMGGEYVGQNNRESYGYAGTDY